MQFHESHQRAEDCRRTEHDRRRLEHQAQPQRDHDMAGDDPNRAEAVLQRLGRIQPVQPVDRLHRATVGETRDVLHRCHLVEPQVGLAGSVGVKRDRPPACLRGQREVGQHDDPGLWNAVHSGDPSDARLYESLGRARSGQGLGELDDELQGMTRRGERAIPVRAEGAVSN